MTTISAPSRGPLGARPLPLSAALRRAGARPELLGLLLLTAFLNFWNLSINGVANTYYAAAVRAMASNWHDFLFNAMDRSGLMTVDKPPLGDWLGALSVKVFGFDSFGLLAPSALCGVIAAGLMYDLVARRFGRTAGLAAGLVLAFTPTIVALSRHNNPDELLVMLSVAALWCFGRALETGRTRPMVWTGVMIGLGFETKMGVALMLVPGFGLAWVWCRWDRSAGLRANLGWMRQALLGGVSLAVVGLAWPVLMWLTPAADRPWISGTSDNSIWSLIVGYNGLGRVAGQSGGPGAFGGGAGLGHRTTGGTVPGLAHLLGGGGGGGGTMFGGAAGPFRLLNDALGSQGGWLLGAALAALVGLGVLTRLRRSDARTGFVLAVGVTGLVVAGVFSYASGIFHPYYVSMLAPWAAALIGAGVGVAAGRERSARWIGPALLLGGLLTEWVVLANDTGGDLAWTRWVALAGAFGGAVALSLSLSRRVRLSVLGLACAALFVAPATWATETLGHATGTTFPTGGPASAAAMGGPGRRLALPGGGPGAFGPPPGLTGGGGAVPAAGFPGGGFPGGGLPGGGPPAGGFPGHTAGAGGGPGGGFDAGSSQLNAAAAWASAHGGGTVAVESQSTAAAAILAGHANVAGIGGFSGRESSVTLTWIREQVRAGRLTYLLGGSSGAGIGAGDGRTGSASAIAAAERSAQTLSITYHGQSFTLYRLRA